MREAVICASCSGVPEHSILGIMLIKQHGKGLVRLGVVHRPGCPELEEEGEGRE